MRRAVAEADVDDIGFVEIGDGALQLPSRELAIQLGDTQKLGNVFGRALQPRNEQLAIGARHDALIEATEIPISGFLKHDAGPV